MGEKSNPNPKPPMVTRSSGEHTFVKQLRRKLESITNEDNAELTEALATLDNIQKKSSSAPPAAPAPEEAAKTPVVKDPRREPSSDPRIDDTPPIDIVSDPFPSTKRSGKV